MANDSHPVYTPLPLPDPNSTEYAQATARRPVSAWRRLLYLVIALIVAGFAGAVGMGWHYWEKSAAFDLSEVAFSQKGSVVQARDGEVIGRLFAQDRLPVDIIDLPGHFIDALIATEDNRFFEHPGFDVFGIGRAALANFRAQDIREGGSTITQQLARYCYDLGGRTLDRKFTEIALAVRIERDYDKHAILEHYLNHIYFGSGFWGVGAAARGYFGKSVGDLDVGESALLCAIIKSPSSYSPFVRPEVAVRERNRSLRRMVELSLIDPHTADVAAAAPLTLADRSLEANRRPQFLLARIQREVRALATEHGLPLDGLLVETSVDSDLQRAVRGHLELGLTRIERQPDYPHATYESQRSSDAGASSGVPDYLQGAAIVVHNPTGDILAAIGGRDFTDSEYNRAFDARRPPGSAFLPLVYAAAIERDDLDVTTEVTDAPMDNRQVMVGGTQGVLGEWGRESFVARYEGQISAGLALLDSRNAATVELGQRAGLEAIRDFTRRAGITSPLRDYPSTFLGQSELTLAELAEAYTTFPNLGRRAPGLRMVTRIHGTDGELLYAAPERPALQPVTDAITAAQINAILNAGLHIGSTRAAYTEHGLEQASVAGKGGTTHGFSDGWFVGYNGVVTCAVWVGFDRPREIHTSAFSRNLALPIWTDLMSALPAAPLALPQDATTVRVCLRCGEAATEHCVESFADGKPYSIAVPMPFAGDQVPQTNCRHHLPPGTLVATAKAAGRTRSASGEASTPVSAGPRKPQVVRSRSPLVIGPDPYADK